MKGKLINISKNGYGYFGKKNDFKLQLWNIKNNAIFDDFDSIQSSKQINNNKIQSSTIFNF